MRALLVVAMAASSVQAARLTPETVRAFDRYIQLTEAQLAQAPPYLKQLARKGETVVTALQTTDHGQPVHVPDGQIHDWMGVLFIPGATIAAVRPVMQDYDNYKRIYKPDVIDSRLLQHNDDRFRVWLRLYKKQFLTLVYNAEYDVQYSFQGPRQMQIVSRSVRIAQVKDPGSSYTVEDPVGDDGGFLWRLNSYWRFQAADGGVYAGCRAISLSRGIPFGFGWLRGFLQRFPREAMVNTLEATARAAAAH